MTILVLIAILFVIGSLYAYIKRGRLSFQNLLIQAFAAVGMGLLVHLLGEAQVQTWPTEAQFWLRLLLFAVVFTLGHRLVRRLSWRHALVDGAFQGTWVFTALVFWA